MVKTVRPKKPAKDTRTKAEKLAAKAAWKRRKADQIARLKVIKRQVAEYDPVGAAITEDTVIRQLQNLLVNDDRAVSRQAEQMELSPGTVQRMRFGLTNRPSFRTVYRMLNAKGVALKGDAPRRKR